MADALTERCWVCTKLCDAERGCIVAPEAYAGHDVLACSDNHFNRAYEMAMGIKPANRTFYDFARVAERRDKGRGKDYGFRIKEIIFEPNFPPYRRDELSKSLRAESFEANSIPYDFNKMPAIFKSWRRNTAYCINDGNENTLCGTGDRWSSRGHGSAGLHEITCQKCKSKWNKLTDEDIERIEEAWERNGFMDSSWYGAETFEATCRDCYGTGGLYDSRLGIDDECATCGGTGESFEADGGIQVAEGYNEWWDELDAIRNEYPPDKFFNRRLGNPKWEDVILEQLYKDGWTPRQALYTWKFYTGQAFAFRVKPDERQMELYEYKLKPQKCGNCGGIGHNRRSCSASRNDPDFDKDKADRNKDGEISDWERAVGNAVAKGIREHKEEKRAEYDDDNDDDDGFKPTNWNKIYGCKYCGDSWCDYLDGTGLCPVKHSDQMDAESFEAEIYDRQGNLRTVDDNFIEATNDKLQALHRLLEANRKQILATNNQDTKTRLREERYRIQDAMAQLREFIDDPINHDGGDFMVRLGAETFEAEQIQYDVMKGKFAKGHEYANYISLHDSYEEAVAVARRERKKLEKDEAIFIVEESFDDETFELDTTPLLSISKSPMIESFPDASKDSFGAESVSDLELKKDSCCCGATKKTPCVCMILGSDCSAKKPMCACYRLKEIQQKDEKGAETFEASTGDIEMDRYLLKEQMERFKDNPDMLKEIEIMVQLYGVGGALNRIEIADEMEREEREREKEESEKRYKGWLKKTKGLTKELKKDPRYRSPFNAESFEAKGDDKYYINNRPQWMPKLMKDSVEDEGEGTYNRYDKGYVAGLFLKSVNDARLNGILKQTNYQDSDVVGFIMPFDLITRKLAKDYEPLILKDNFGKSKKYLVINGTPYNYDIFNSMLMRLPPTTEVRISGKPKSPLMFEFKFLNEPYLMFLAPYVGDDFDASQHGDYAKEVMSKSGAGFGFKSPLPENWDEQKKMSKELKDKQLREDIEKVVAVGHSYDPSKEPLSLSPPVPQWNERKWERGTVEESSEGNDPDFDPEKADRDNDGEISDWERAVGNAVAKGIREHKEKKEAETFEAPSCNCERFDRSDWDSNRCATCGEMKKGHYGAESRPASYMVKSDAHKLNEASKRIHDKADEKREYPEWWKSKLSVVRNDADKLSDFLDYAVVEGVFESEGDHDHEEIDELIDKLNTVVDFAITFVHDGGYGGEPKGILVDEDLGIKTEVVHYIEGSIQLNLVRDIDTNELLSVRFSLTGDPDQTPIVYLPLPEEITTVPEDDRVSAKN